MTPAQAAEFMCASVDSVRRWSAAGLLPYLRTPGGHRRYRRSDLEEALAAVNQEAS